MMEPKPLLRWNSLLILGMISFVSCANASRVAKTDPVASADEEEVEEIEIDETPITNMRALKLTGKLQKKIMLDGSANRATLHTTQKMNLVGRFGKISFPAYLISQSKDAYVYECIFAVPHSTKPGSKNFSWVWKSDGKEQLYSMSFTVKSGKYGFSKLTVDPKLVKPPESEMPRIIREQNELKKIYSSSEPVRIWSAPLDLPINNVVTGAYGKKRMYNGVMKSFHNGVDLRALVPTPIYAPTDGKVVLAKDLYFTGGTVILDHGLGFFSIYAHMSKLDVKVGDRVSRSKKLGLSGATGRVEAPHLHWGTFLKGVKINPMSLVELLKK